MTAQVFHTGTVVKSTVKGTVGLGNCKWFAKAAKLPPDHAVFPPEPIVTW